MTKQFIEEHIEWLAKLDPRLVPVEIAYSAIYREKLKKLILATEEEIRKSVEGMKMVFDPENMPYGYEDPATVDGYNYALEHIKQFILKAKE